MKVLLRHIILFSIPILVFVIACEIGVRNIHGSVYEQKRNQLINDADSIEVLILGNSHSTYGINPNQFTLYAFNLASEDQSLYFDRKLVEKYLPDLPNLKYVLITVDYHNLCFEHAKDRDFFYKYFYDISYKNRNYYKEYFLQSFFVYTPQRTLTLIKNSLIYGNEDIISPRGWTGRVDVDIAQKTTSIEKYRLRADKFNKNIENYENNKDIVADLECLITTLKSKNIVPILITCPAYKTFRECLEKEIVEEIRTVPEFLAKKHGIMYLDYLEDDSYILTDYYDYCDHLNIIGAQKLTQQVDAAIMNREVSTNTK
jgi:hypothetical protein